MAKKRGKGIGAGFGYKLLRGFLKAGGAVGGTTSQISAAQIMGFGVPLQQVFQQAMAGNIEYRVGIGLLLAANYLAVRYGLKRNWSHNGKGHVYTNDD